MLVLAERGEGYPCRKLATNFERYSLHEHLFSNSLKMSARRELGTLRIKCPGWHPTTKRFLALFQELPTYRNIECFVCLFQTNTCFYNFVIVEQNAGNTQVHKKSMLNTTPISDFCWHPCPKTTA